MGDDAGGLSDVLRRMAEGDTGRKRANPGRPASESRLPPPPAGRQVSRPTTAPPASRPELTATPDTPPHVRFDREASTRTRPRSARPDPFKAAAVPVCLATAALLLIPTGWAILVLAGFDVWRSDWPNARTVAMAALTCLPLAVALVGGAGFMHWHART